MLTVSIIINVLLMCLVFFVYKILIKERSFSHTFGKFYQIKKVNGDLEVVELDYRFAFKTENGDVVYFLKEEFENTLLECANLSRYGEKSIKNGIKKFMGRNWSNTKNLFHSLEDAENERNELLIKKIR